MNKYRYRIRWDLHLKGRVIDEMKVWGRYPLCKKEGTRDYHPIIYKTREDAFNTIRTKGWKFNDVYYTEEDIKNNNIDWNVL